MRRRAANASEERTISKGGWVRVDRKNRKPGSKKGYGTGSKVRPQFKYKKKKKSGTTSRTKRSGYRMTPARRAALRKAQRASAAKRRGRKRR